MFVLLSCCCFLMIHGNRLSFPMTRLPITKEEMHLHTALRNNQPETFLNDGSPLKMPSGTTLPKAVEAQMHLGTGVHTIDAIVGQQKRVLIVDTGSGDTAFPCQGCVHCGAEHANPMYEFTTSASYVSCEVNELLGLQECESCDSKLSQCMYGQKYVEGSTWQAKKVQDLVSFGHRDDLQANIVFGCIYEEHGAFEEQSADGIMGMSRDADAVFLQFYREGATSSKMFSQCISATGGSMVIGGVDPLINNEQMSYTPLREDGYNYWTVSMLSMQVGDAKVPVQSSIFNAGRGCVFDSGTTFVYLPRAVETPFRKVWKENVPLGHVVSNYESGGTYELTQADLLSLPKVCFNLQNDASLCIPASQYMKQHGDNPNSYVATLFFRDFAHATIIGASALANHNIVYDMDNCRIGFAQANCDSIGAQTSLAIQTAPEGDSFTPVVEWHWINMGMSCLAMISIMFLLKMKSQYEARESDSSYVLHR